MKFKKIQYNLALVDTAFIVFLIAAMCSQLNLGDIGKDTTAQGYVTKQLKVALPDIALFLNFLWFAARTTMMRAWKKLWWPPFPCYALLFAMVLAALHSRPLVAAIAENLTTSHGPKAFITKESKEAIAEIIQFAGYFLIAPLLFVNVIHDRRVEPVISRRRVALWSFGFFLGLALVWAALQKVRGMEDPQGLFGSPNALAAFTALALPLFVARLFHRRTEPKAAIGIVAAALLLCLYTLVSLWSVLAIVGGATILIALQKPQRITMYAVAPLLLIFAGLWVSHPTAGRDLFMHLQGAPDKHGKITVVKKQYIEWFAAATRLADPRESSFSTGVAPGNYQFSIGTFFNRLSSDEKVKPDSNNLYLVQAINIGVLGLGALLWVVWYFGRLAWTARGRFQDDWLGAAVITSIAVWAFLNIFHALIVRGTGVAFALILSFAVIATEYAWDEQEKKALAKRNFLDAALS